MDGVLFSDHTPTPGLAEYKKAIEPVQVLEGFLGHVTVINRYDFVTLDHLVCEWSFVGDGAPKRVGGQLEIPTGVLPGHTAQLAAPRVLADSLPGEGYLELRFVQRDATIALPAGHEVATGQILINGADPLTRRITPGKISVSRTSRTTLQVTTSTSVFSFSIITAVLTSWRRSGVELIHAQKGPLLDFYRPLADNDRLGPDGAEWLQKRLHQLVTDTRSVNWHSSESSVTVVVETRIAPPVLEWSIDVTTTYSFFPSGSIKIVVKGRPQGLNLPSTFARIGLIMSLVPRMEQVTWFGRGPGESYRDKKLSQLFGTYKKTVDELWTDYEFPQESGNRTDVRWVTISDGANEGPSLTARFGLPQGFSFQASHYASKDVDLAKHPFELHRTKKPETILRLDAFHHGLGTAACGPKTLHEYALQSEPLNLRSCWNKQRKDAS